MAQTNCGFDSIQGGATGQGLLAVWGPTILVDIGFDPAFDAGIIAVPQAGIKGIQALVDTGAAECCIDNLLAAQLNLPIADRRPISGIQGRQIANLHLAQIHIPSLYFTMYGLFAGVDLQAGGQRHSALLGRSCLRLVTMVYEGRTGKVVISTD